MFERSVRKAPHLNSTLLEPRTLSVDAEDCDLKGMEQKERSKKERKNEYRPVEVGFYLLDLFLFSSHSDLQNQGRRSSLTPF